MSNMTDSNSTAIPAQSTKMSSSVTHSIKRSHDHSTEHTDDRLKQTSLPTDTNETSSTSKKLKINLGPSSQKSGTLSSQKPGIVTGKKISFGGFKMGLQKPTPKAPLAPPPAGFGGGPVASKTAVSTTKIAAAFDDEEEEEEMPPEAKMRMKNIGRNTPTSAGPNSFGKFRMGFCDSKKMYERQLKELLDEKPSGKGD